MLEKIESSSPKASQNYQIAQQAFQHTLSITEGSSNRLSAEERKTPKGKDIIRRINQMRDEPIHQQEYTYQWIYDIAQLTLKYRVGNCCEKACTLFDFIYNLPHFNSNVELFNNPFSDHFFVVLGRDPLTDPTDPRTWNIDALICDPWIEDRSYFIGEIDFENLANNKRTVINYLSPQMGTPGSIILSKDVLVSTQENQRPMIASQPCMVLRSQFYEKKLTTHNTSVLMVYEQWDLPKPKHYQKYQKQGAANRFFSERPPFAPVDMNRTKRPNH